ncbi:MAG: hypothetical protein LDLANPLL_01380 [Turneriella sp.]|nr:hypothetical protein [Turneriella sp.]
MTAILIATKGEAYFFLKKLSSVKKEGIFHYRGIINGKKIALYLTRPGVRAKEQLRRFLRLYPWRNIIATGTCANLTSTLSHGDAVQIGCAVNADASTLQIAPTGVTAVSIEALVVKDSTKADLRSRTNADVLDMETYTIASVMAEAEFAKIPWSAIRVVDDTPGEEKYLLKEQMLREMLTNTPSGKLKWRDIWAFGVWDYIRILLRRHQMAKAIFTAVQKSG